MNAKTYQKLCSNRNVITEIVRSRGVTYLVTVPVGASRAAELSAAAAALTEAAESEMS